MRAAASLRAQIEWCAKKLADLVKNPSVVVDTTVTDTATLKLAELWLVREIARLSDLLPLLDNISISDPLNIQVIEFVSNASVRKRFYLQFSKPSLSRGWLFDMFRDMQMANQQACFSFRAQMECMESYRDGWFVVFDTLTYDPARYKNMDFVKLVTNWFKMLRHRVCKACYGVKDSPQGVVSSDYFRYSVVFEHHKDGRLHAHCLYHMKKLPDGTSYADPNQRCLNQPKRLQPVDFPRPEFGFSNPIAVRNDAHDAFSRLGWSWPLDKSGQPRKPSAPLALARYLSKYMSKETGVCRCRMSQNYGLKGLMIEFKMMTLPELFTCHEDASRMNLTYHQAPIPTSLQKILARRAMSHLLRDSLSGSLIMSNRQKKCVLSKKVFSEIMNLRNPSDLLSREQLPRLNVSRLIHDSTLLIRTLSRLSFGTLAVRSMINLDTFNRIIQGVLDNSSIVYSLPPSSGPLSLAHRVAVGV
ncbi:rolling circle replication-associated protein [Thiolapillus sp.]|uniref:rolling circle replication-associated protein n=1 Tax=Thiolapillus sp. TaxID=2017437 RepID=UPI003AF8460E